MSAGSLGRGVLASRHVEPVSWQLWKLPAYLVLLVLSVQVGATYDGPADWLVRAVLLVFGALQLIGVFGLLHESAHGHLVGSQAGNRRIGELMSVLVATSYPGYRTAHLLHHSAFRTERDPQEILFPRRGKAFTAAYLLVASTIGAPVFLLVRCPWITFRRHGVLRAVWAPLTAIALYAGLVTALPDAQGSFLLVLLAVALVLGSMNDIVYHQGLVPDDTLAACTSFDCDVFGQLFLSGANRHAEHHAYPAVPGPRLVSAARDLRPHLHAVGVPFERSFTGAFVKRFLLNPFFLPPAGAVERSDEPVGKR